MSIRTVYPVKYYCKEGFLDRKNWRYKEMTRIKIIIQAILCSFIIHIVYFISTMIVGNIKRKRYVPDIEAAWESVEKFPSRISFGPTI
jgi:hypothetical protein